MKAIKHILTMVLMASILCAAAVTQAPVFGQKSNDNRPPKEQPKIKEKDKPPPSNNNSQGNSNRGKKP